MTLLLVIIYIVFISLGLPDSLFGASWPVIHLDFGINESFASLYGVITGACTGGVSFISGWLIRKLGTGKVTLISTLLTVAGLFIMSVSPNIVIMMLGAVVLGYGAGVIDTALNNFISLHYKTQHMNWLHACWGVGVTISPLIMSAFLTDETGSWRNGYRVVALLQLSIGIIIALTLNKWKIVKEDFFKEESKESQKSLFEVLKIKGVLPSILSQGLYCSMEFTIGTWGASYLVNVHSLSPADAAKWISLFFGGIMVGRIVSGFISMKTTDNTMIRGGIVVSFLGMVLLTLPLGNISFLGLLLIGVGFGPIFPSILHSVPDRFGKEYSADITGFHMGGAYGIGFAIQLIFGFVATATTFNITPFVLLALCIGLFIANETTIKTLKKK
ncbi:MAG: MFS transporter [Ruminococcaceae bacterium]|nr:MFS transporter [Oscillospiraceae bacterium]